MQALKIGQLWRIACFCERFETHFDKLDNAAAKHGLFAKEICFCFVFKRCVDNRCAAAANGRGVGFGEL